MKLTEAQRAALKKIVACQLEVWNASTEAEVLLGRDIDCGSHGLEQLCAAMCSPEDVERLSDETLIETFGLEEDGGEIGESPEDAETVA